MKNLKLFAISILFFPFLLTAQNAGDHMDDLNSVFGDLKKDTWKYLKAVTRGKSAKKVEKKRENLLEEYREQKNYVQSVKVYDGDNSLKNAMMHYLDLSYKILKEDFDEILDMEAIAEQSYDAMEAYILANEKANDKLEEASDELDEAVKEYAKKYDINLIEAEEDKKSQKIKRASLALKHYNTVYLMFFKVYKQEAYVLDAQAKNDIVALEQNNNTLQQFAEEELHKLDTLQPFEGDRQLIIAARKIITFYKNEAENDFPIYVDFHVKKDNFEKAQKIMESKKKKDRTQEDVDQYNKAVDEYNKAVNDYNKANESMNEKRGEQLEAWNKSVEDFFDDHN